MAPPSLGDYPELEAALYALRSSATRITSLTAARKLWYVRAVEHAQSGKATHANVGTWLRRPGRTRTIQTFDRDRFTRRHPVEAGQCRRWVDRIEARGAVESTPIPERLTTIGDTVPGISKCSANYYELSELLRSSKAANESARSWLKDVASDPELQERLLAEGAVDGAWVRFQGSWAFQLGREQFSRDLAWELFPDLTKPYTATEIKTDQDTWRFVLLRDEDSEGAVGL